MKPIFNKLKIQFEENPLAAIGIGALAVTAAARFLDSISAFQGRRAYAKQINYKIRRKK